MESPVSDTPIVVGVAMALLASGCLVGNYLFCRSERYSTISEEEAQNLAIAMESTVSTTGSDIEPSCLASLKQPR